MEREREREGGVNRLRNGNVRGRKRMENAMAENFDSEVLR